MSASLALIGSSLHALVERVGHESVAVVIEHDTPALDLIGDCERAPCDTIGDGAGVGSGSGRCRLTALRALAL